MARIEVVFDATQILRWIKLCQESMFIDLYDFTAMESELNLLNISLQDE